MTLEDFFTLTEMRDGLSSLPRIEELLSMIQKLNDSVTSNLGDAVRQWSTVASVLAATDNKECVNQFLQLNGLVFLNQWLQEALKLHADVSGVEELISSLLTFFERFPIELKQITASGIGVTIELLLDHKSIPIKEKARILYDKWNHARNDGKSCHDQETSGTCQSDQLEPFEDVQMNEKSMDLVNSVVDIPPCTERTGEGKCEVKLAGTEIQVADVTVCSGSSPHDSTYKERVIASQKAISTSSNPINPNAVSAEVCSSGSSLVSTSCQEKLTVIEGSSVSVAVGKSSTGTGSQSGREGDTDDQPDASLLKNVPDSVRGMDVEMREVKPCKSNQRETCGNSSSVVFSTSVTPSVAAPELTNSCQLDSNNGDSCASKAMLHELSSGAFDHGREKCLITAKESNTAANLASGIHELACTVSNLSDPGDPQLPCQREEAMSSVLKGTDGEVNLNIRKGHFLNSPDFLKVVGTKANKEIGRKSDMRLECLDDALEVARQVAIAVEQEVVDYREPFCSSPEVNSGGTTGSHNPDSEEEKQDQPVTEEIGGNSSSAGNGPSVTTSTEKGSEITQNMSPDQENSEQNIESPKPKVPAQESVGKSIADRFNFDLNSDICSDEPECPLKPILKMPIGVSAPVAVIACSKGAPGLPVTPLCFGGEMGWKGSAATSAFRPASPRRTPDGERSSSGSKPKTNSLEFDLNVAERADDVGDEPILVKELPASSSLPSGDSCVEVSSRRTEKLSLDLNRLGDEETSMCPSSSLKLHFQSGERSLSSASSSSSRQPFLRDFDLNDNPSFPNIGNSCNFDMSSTKPSDSFGVPTPTDPVIKIMGSKIAVERKANDNQVQQSFLSVGLKMEPPVVARPLMPYTNMPTPTYGYTGLPTGPSVSVPPAYYSPGNISYMVDSRGATVMPHVTGSAALGLTSARPPFLIGAAMPSNMAGFGSLQPGLDLNGGMTSVEGGIREGSSFRQFFLQGHGRWMEEQPKTGAQPSSSDTTLKRKEPDSGWEPYPHGYKQMTSWQ
ncbi:uncharacterized protein LOC135598637 [Musa acuminata AAA Group]|uniref:uncharacterized protein LOC135598637 n=1 Tax=Musa acuminata AAA Group TaxID=214697 RepID=UPI0031DFE3D0